MKKRFERLKLHRPHGLGLLDLIAGVVCVVASVSCSKSADTLAFSAQQERRAQVDKLAEEPDLAGVSAAADRAAHYLAGLCDAAGRFEYLQQIGEDEDSDSKYNVLRHAGAVYALAQYCQTKPNRDVRAAMLRAAGYLKQQCLAPVGGNPNLLAIWSEPAVTGSSAPRQAKLGGAGLALVALLHVEQIEPGFTSLEQLRGLGRFLVYMQKSDGSFYSKYYPDVGRSDIWQSMYYPGEAAFGLLLLFEKDPSPQWLHTATKALRSLAFQGRHQQPLSPDQWYMLAAERWWRLAGEDADTATRSEILAHTRRLCQSMLQDQQGQLGVPGLRGCYTPEGRSCPTATRLEGLMAALGVLPPSDEALHDQVRQSVRLGMQFLLRCQIHAQPHRGAVTRVVPAHDAAALSDAERRRRNEVRIDYVQHALSAMLAYQRVFAAAQKRQAPGGE